MITLLLLLGLVAPALVSPVFAHESADQAAHPHIQEVFVFTSAEDDQRLIAGFTTEEFKTDTIYQLNFDTNRDGNEDRVIQTTVRNTGAGELEATVTEPSTPERTGEKIQKVKIPSISGAVSTHANPVVLAERGKSIRAFVGLRDNPVGGDTTAGKNSEALVVDLPLNAILAEHKPDFDFWISVYDKDSND